MNAQTDSGEFIKFYCMLRRSGIDEPFILALVEGGKDPIPGRSWKIRSLTKAEAVKHLNAGGNVGIAGTDGDKLVIIDIDDQEGFTGHTFKPTLTARSSSRIGLHKFYVADDNRCKFNTALSEIGELRANWQYVVAPGSYAELSDSINKDGNVTKTIKDKLLEVPEADRANAGKYTIESDLPLAPITYEGIPKVFTDAIKARQENDRKRTKTIRKPRTTTNRNRSALFDLTIKDVVNGITDRGRHPSLFHDSHTGKNTSISNGLLHCWRHNVSHNAITALAVLAGLCDCVDAGTGHAGSGSGQSYVDYGDGETIFKLWAYAKDKGMIPQDDPIPAKALVHYALSNKICKSCDIEDGWKMSNYFYDVAIATMSQAGISHGRPLRCSNRGVV